MTTPSFCSFRSDEIQNPNFTVDKALISYDCMRRDIDSLLTLILYWTMTADRLLVG
jgi:hypothetical protein